ncbi:MAG: hypothetical protein AAF702_31465 [Chloroflexota bacterium]
MYGITLMLHSYIRWLVLIVMCYGLIRAWWGLLRKREWLKADDLTALAFTWVISLQFILGTILFFIPSGIAQAAWQNFSIAMQVRDLRFFGLEHPLQMIIALTIVHIGSARARKAEASARQFRWAAICFTLATVLILTAIPWWRPWLRGVL